MSLYEEEGGCWLYRVFILAGHISRTAHMPYVCTPPNVIMLQVQLILGPKYTKTTVDYLVWVESEYRNDMHVPPYLSSILSLIIQHAWRKFDVQLCEHQTKYIKTRTST